MDVSFAILEPCRFVRAMRRYTVLSLDFRHIILLKNNSLSSQSINLLFCISHFKCSYCMVCFCGAPLVEINTSAFATFKRSYARCVIIIIGRYRLEAQCCFRRTFLRDLNPSLERLD
jgi:hypothetical protein